MLHRLLRTAAVLVCAAIIAPGAAGWGRMGHATVAKIAQNHLTKTAREKVNEILQALQKSVVGRKDKTRAFVQELHAWQKDEYIDAHFNARVMYDELGNMLPLPFGYEVFKKHYNNTRF